MKVFARIPFSNFKFNQLSPLDSEFSLQTVSCRFQPYYQSKMVYNWNTYPKQIGRAGITGIISSAPTIFHQIKLS
jgi:hypothetical protein